MRNHICFISFLLIIFPVIHASGMEEEALSGSADSSFTIRGKVMDSRGEPVPGVAISIEGELDMPEVSDSTGYFTLEVNSMDAWILVAPADQYKSARIYLNQRENLDIYLTAAELASIHDKVQTPFGQMEKKTLVYPEEGINPRQMAYHPDQNADQTLQGLIPGLFATGHSGMPGSGVSYYIRGITSMNSTNQPLYIIDGIPIESGGLLQSHMEGYSSNPLALIDPNDITSISVYKDFGTGSQFGMRGSNGVVLVETLKPTELQTSIDFGLRTGMAQAPEAIPMLNSQQYRSLANEVLLSSGQYEENFPESYPGLYLREPEKGYHRYNHDTRWQNEVFDNSLINDVYLRVKGGDQITRYGLSVGYLNHSGTLRNTSFDRFNVRLIGTFNIFSWLRMYITSNMASSNSSLRESAQSLQTSPILSSLLKAPLLNPYGYDDTGAKLSTFDDVDELGISNPSVIINKTQSALKSTRFLTSIRLQGDLTDKLKINSIIGVNYLSSEEFSFFPDFGMELFYDDEVYNMSRSMGNLFFSLYNNNYMSYVLQPGARSKLQMRAGLSLQTNRREEDWGISRNSNENDEYTSLQSGTSYLWKQGGWNDRWNRMSLYASAAYTRSDRYMLQATVNNEFSSKNGRLPGNDWEGIYFLNEIPVGLFYSLGMAWRVSGEHFLKNLSWMEDLKLRLTWGSAGNDDIGTVSSRRYYSSVLYREASGLIPGSLADESLHHENSFQLNPGMDLSLWGGRFRFSADWFSTRTENMHVYVPAESYTGYTRRAINGGSMLTQGWEVSSTYRIIARNKLSWDLGFNLASYENEVLSISNDQIITPFPGGAFISKVGEPLQSFFGYEFEGVFSSTMEAEEAELVNGKGIPFKAGDARFKDQGSWDPVIKEFTSQKDQVIDGHDRTIIGSPVPDLYGGIHTHFRLGRWSAGALIQFVYGNEVFNYLRYQAESMTGLSNQSTNVLNRWQYEGHQTKTPRATWNDPAGNADFSTRWIEDGSYVRLKNLHISYRLNSQFLIFRNAEIFATASNLYTFSRYLGYDPEFSYSYHNMEQGIDYGMTPHTRKFILGIKMGL